MDGKIVNISKVVAHLVHTLERLELLHGAVDDTNKDTAWGPSFYSDLSYYWSERDT
jgi:hypothetical protein